MLNQDANRGNDSVHDTKCVRCLESQPLSIGFIPGPMDVICSRGKSSFNHPGNRQYRKIIRLALPQYSAAKTKSDKSLIVSNTINFIRQGSSCGIGFVKLMDDGRWYEVGENIVREKIGQSFRDLLHNKYSSSSKAKQMRKKRSKESSELSDKTRKVTLREEDVQLLPNTLDREEQSPRTVDNEERYSVEGNHNKEEHCVVEELLRLSYIGDSDEAFPIDAPVVAFPDVSPNDSFCTSEDCSNSDAMDTFFPESETNSEKGEMHEDCVIQSSFSPLLLSTEPISLDQTALMSENCYNELITDKEEILVAMASLWEREEDWTKYRYSDLSLTEDYSAILCKQ